MKVKSNSIWTKLIYYSTENPYDMPTNICSYFWTLFFVILLLPVNFPILLYNYSKKNNTDLFNSHLYSIIFPIIGIGLYIGFLVPNDVKERTHDVFNIFLHNHPFLVLWISSMCLYACIISICYIIKLIKYIKVKFCVKIDYID